MKSIDLRHRLAAVLLAVNLIERRQKEGGVKRK